MISKKKKLKTMTQIMLTLSIGLPEPFNIRPSISSETGVRKMSPVNSQDVFLASIPAVPSKTWN